MSFIGNMWKLGMAGYLASKALEGIQNGSLFNEMRQAGYTEEDINLVSRHANRHFDGNAYAAYQDLRNRGQI